MRNHALTVVGAKFLIGAAVVAGFSLATSQAHAQLMTGTFEAGYTLGDVQGQNGWSYAPHGYMVGTVVAAPAGSPGFLAAKSLLISTASTLNGVGVTVGVETPENPSGPVGVPGSKVVYGPNAGSGPTSTFAIGDYFFRTAAPDSTAAQAEGITDGTTFLTTTLDSGSDRFGRPALFTRTGTTYSVSSDYYASVTPAFNAVPASDNFITKTVATGLNFGHWYEEKISLTMGPVTTTLNGDGSTTYNDTDVMNLSVYDATTEALVGSAQSGTWTVAWDQAATEGFPATGQSTFALTGLNFVLRTNLGVNTPLMFIDLPEPASLTLLAAGGMCIMGRRRRTRARTTHPLSLF